MTNSELNRNKIILEKTQEILKGLHGNDGDVCLCVLAAVVSAFCHASSSPGELLDMIYGCCRDSLKKFSENQGCSDTSEMP